MDELISKAVAAFRNSPSSGDAEIYCMLVSEGLQRDLAARLVEFVPVVYCRLMLARSGARFPNTYRRRLVDGQLSAERPLLSEPVWIAAQAFALNELEQGVSPKDLLAVAGRCAEFDAANRMLKNGSDLKSVVFTPTLLTWPESGPEN